MIVNNYNIMPKYAEENYRCDPFTKIHDGKHILFIGDSFAAGDGLEPEDTWCYKLYNKISKNEKVSGYFNAGTSGSSISQAVDQFFKYCYNYGNPDIVFFVTTEFDRDLRYSNFENLESFIYRMYFYLEQYCRSSNIQLYSFSWLKSVDLYTEEPKRYVYNGGTRPLWTEQTKTQQSFNLDILYNFETFYNYDVKNMMMSVFEYDKVSKTPEKSLWAKDNVHPGTSFHEFYADFMFSKYLEKNK